MCCTDPWTFDNTKHILNSEKIVHANHSKIGWDKSRRKKNHAVWTNWFKPQDMIHERWIFHIYNQVSEDQQIALYHVKEMFVVGTLHHNGYFGTSATLLWEKAVCEHLNQESPKWLWWQGTEKPKKKYGQENSNHDLHSSYQITTLTLDPSTE